MSEAIEFEAAVYSVRTVVTDHGIHITFELPETAIPQMAMLAECRRQGIYLHVKATATDDRPKPTKPRY
jgi:hypothetical protein